MSNFIEWILSLFTKNKKEKDINYNIENLIRLCFINNFLNITGKRSDVSIKKVSFQEYKDKLAGITDGFIFSTFDLTGEFSIHIIIAKAFIDKYYNNYITTNNIADLSFVDFIDLISGNVPKLFFIDRNAKNNTALVKTNITLPRTINTESHDEILWNTSGYLPFQIRVEEISLFVLINEDSYKRLNEDLKLEDIRIKIKSLLNSTKSALYEIDKSDSLSYKIKKPKEFILSNFLLADRLNSKSFILKSILKEIIVQNNYDNYLDEKGLWLIINLKYKEYDVNLIYYFRCEDVKAFESNYYSFKEFILTQSNYVYNYHKEKMKNPDIKINLKVLAKIEEQYIKDVEYSFNYSLKINYNKLECMVFTSNKYIESLMLLFIPPWELIHILKNLNNLIVRMLSLNTALLSKNFNAVLDNMLNKERLPGNAEISTFPFYQFIELIDDKDLKLVIQNYLAINYSLNDILVLFSVKIPYTNSEGETSFNIIQFDFDTDRFMKFMPRNHKEERIRGFSYELAYFEKFNKKVMYDIFDLTMNEKLLLSDKSKYILDKMFYELVEAKEEEEINKLIADDIPFIHLKSMNKTRITSVLNSLKTIDLAYLLLKYDNYNAFVNEHISEKKSEDLFFLLKRSKEDYNNKKIKTREIKRVILKLNDEFKAENERVKLNKRS